MFNLLGYAQPGDTQPDAFARWLTPNGFSAPVYEMDVKVGGNYLELQHLARLVEPNIPDRLR